MTVNIFKPEDFVDRLPIDSEWESKHLADFCNNKVKEYAEDNWPRVYGKPGFNRSWITPLTDNNIPIGSSYQAYLAFHEPIKKMECNHKPYFYNNTFMAECKCGAKLKMPETWEAE